MIGNLIPCALGRCLGGGGFKVGDKWQVFVPSDLAYGLLGRGEKIGPNTTLIFEIELLDIE